ASVLEDDELPGIHLRDLGLHRLKDLDRLERIYQLDIDGLLTEFPPLRTGDAPAADSEDKPAAWRRLRTRGSLTAALVACLVAVVVIAGIVTTLGSPQSPGGLPGVGKTALGLINLANQKSVGQMAVGATPSHVAAGAGAIWVTNADGDSVSRLDAVSKSAQTIAVGSQPSGIAVGNGAVWVANS